MEPERICTKCKKQKSREDFYFSKTEQRHSSWCKICFLAYHKNYYSKNKEKLNPGRLQNIRKAKEKWVSSGRCYTCGKSKLKNSRYCELHYIRSAMRYAFGHSRIADAKILLAKFKTNGQKCPYTGEPLILGGNTHLDHILPRSRFPDLINSIDNVEWVSGVANRAKGTMTKDEFLSKYKIVYTR